MKGGVILSYRALKDGSLNSQGERPDGNRKNEQALVSCDAGIANSVLLSKLLSDNQKVMGAKQMMLLHF